MTTACEFPKRAWFSNFHTFKPIFKGSDEFGCHTICIGIPYVLHIVISLGPCAMTGKCADMAEFACTFPACPYSGMTPGGLCITHDEDYWREVVEEERP